MEGSGTAEHGLDLGLYVLGALTGEERERVERHLAGCARCQDEADVLAEVVAAFTVLTEEDRRQIVQEFGVHRRPGGRTRHVRAGGLPGGLAGRPAPAGQHRARPGPGVAPGAGTGTGAAANRLVRRPGAGRSHRRTRGLVGLAALAVAGLVLAGVLLVPGLGGPGDRPGGIAPAAAGVDAATGASVSVRISERPDGTADVRATVTGLRAGTPYRLYAVAADGGTRLVTAWTSAGSPDDVSGELPAASPELSFFTITLADDTPIVSAYLLRSGAGGTPGG
ncbi:zf-HC2 domain-containing protein [Plantactinospora sp. KBS50]|uniref:zf-HC2 domain-containing protein n=1 Tax=Plantactinospora sp. KBS50 TaxID=2024580 RepID=UPI000BAAA7BA|nr:zf-HC2 domain-containing protein [Plantactinospora sp. KBS50]ASW53436.1 hypothetical protein CIK06_03420 [Plantactinospora sp. KBS50]